MSTLLQAQALGLQYKAHVLLSDVSLELRGGEVLGIVGANGAGKSTLLRLLAGIEPASQGSVSLDGQPLPVLGAQQCAQRIAWLEQRPQVHWPLPAREVVALGRLPFQRQEDAATAAAQVQRALQESGTEAWAERRVDELSEGEKLLVNLARILAVGSEVILVDEPTSALDPRHQLRIMQVLRARAATGVAVAAVLHDLSLAWRHCDRLLLLHEGRALALGTPQAVLQADLLRQCFGLSVDIDSTRRQVLFLPEPATAATTR